MVDYNPRKTEPTGEGVCSNCGENHENLWSDEYDSDAGEFVAPLCVPCLCEKRPSDYPNALLQDTTDYTIQDQVIILDFGYGLEVMWEYDLEKVPASRNPNETKTVRQPSIKKTGDVYYKGEKVGTFTSKSWRKYAQEKLNSDYSRRRGRW